MTGWYSLLSGVALKSILVLGAAGLVAILMRRRSAAARHTVWMAAFASLLALPLFSVLLPALPSPHWMPAQVVFQVTAPLRSRLNIDASEPRALASAAPAGSRRQPGRTAPLVLWVWFAGTASSLAQMALAWLAAARIRRKSPNFPGTLIDGVTVLESRPGSMPMTFGLLRPAIFLPSDAAGWTAERRRLVLEHELAHVRRGDAGTNLLARFVLSFYWWNPLAWLAWRRFVHERERAADDMVLRSGVRPSDYAGHLVAIASAMAASRAIGSAAVAMVRHSQLEGRLLAILDGRINRRAPRRATAWIAALVTIALIAPLGALRAQETQTVPADVDATIRAAAAQKNHQMLDGAARAAEAYRQYDLARKLLDSSLTIRVEVSGQGSVDYGLGLVKLGDLEASRGSGEAETFYSKAVSVLGTRPESARALIRLGTFAMTRKDTQQAFDYFQKAQFADPGHAGQALMWMAVVREQQKDFDAAESFLKQALAVEEDNSPELATTLGVYASFLKRNGDVEKATTLVARSAQIQTALGVHAPAVRQTAGTAALHVGNGVAAPMLQSKVEPPYSEEARLACLQGTVAVAVTVDTDGTARDMKIIRGLGLGLDEKALQAISQWKFKPGAKDGEPVPVLATIEVNFRLL